MSALLGALVLVPLGGAVVAAAVPARARAVVAFTIAVGTAGIAVGTAVRVAGSGPLHSALAGWGAPLGIDLRADGLSAALVTMTAIVGLAATLYASATREVRGSDLFWPLWLALWAGLNAVYVSADLFNIYVALELASLAAVGLVALGGRSALAPALRYLFVAVLGSLAYLLGVALLYGETGTLDIAAAGERLGSSGVAVAALAVMAVGLMLKTALFPLHAWLPAAHSAAPSAVSPVLSALVVKASFYVLVRIWFTIFDTDVTVPSAQVLGTLGAAAVVWGAVLALRQDRLKRVVAYSTVAQVGYLFLLFPLVTSGSEGPSGSRAAEAALAGWTGVLGLALAHGLAKAAMFMSAGSIALGHGSDRLSDLRGAATRMPMSALTFAIAGVSLAGLPPTFGFVGKWQALQASLGSGQWWWLPVLLLGGLLTMTYTIAVMRALFADPGQADDLPPLRPVPRRMELAALALAALAVAVGLRSIEVLELLQVAAPMGGGS